MEVKTRALISSRSPLATFLLAAALAVSGCSAGADAPAAAPTAPAATPSTPAGVTVVQPGSPGEPTATGDDVVAPEPAPWSHADIAFVQMMVPHHAQAVQMSRWARERAGSDDVRRLAARIEAAQAPEILLMASWLEEQGVEVPSATDAPGTHDHAAHGHDGMEGMLTPAELDRLRAARGAAFDRLYLRGMIRHHAGAVTMAEEVTVDGTALSVSELAADVAAGQSAEIGRMRDLLAEL